MRIFLIILLLSSLLSNGQTIKILAERKGISFRGLSVVDKKIIWVSGSNGTIGKSQDGGLSWKWMIIKDFEKRDFRDIEAFDEKIAIVMAVGEPGIILKTNDGGNSWKTVYVDNAKGIFLDAMDFRKNGIGMIVGDPIEETIYVATTKDFGESWKKQTSTIYQKVINGEAMFASSGTNIQLLHDTSSIIITGGSVSRFWHDNTVMDLPILQGCSSCGGNSIASKRTNLFLRKMVIVGGDFSKDTNIKGNCIYSNNSGKKWKSPIEPPHGYRSCITFISSNKMITCGTSGVDISLNGGKNWKLISKESFHVCKKSKTGTKVFLAGKERVAVLEN